MPKTRLLIVSLLVFLISVTIVVAAPQLQQTTSPVNINATNNTRVYAAWQPFQNGVMMWWQDTGQIWVYWNGNDFRYDNGGVLFAYQNTYQEGMANPSMGNCTIPAVRGFGQVWKFGTIPTQSGGQGSVEALMGCPLATEIGFDTAARFQTQGSSIFLLQGPGATQYAVDINSQLQRYTWYMVRIS